MSFINANNFASLNDEVVVTKPFTPSTRLAVFGMVATENNRDDRNLSQEIFVRFKRLIDRDKLHSQDLELQVLNGVVSVTGQVNDIRESHRVLKIGVSVAYREHLPLYLGNGHQDSARIRELVPALIKVANSLNCQYHLVLDDVPIDVEQSLRAFAE